ncbi:MAG: ribonuclease E activity regulator RraA [Myxococcota bacterium]
MAFPTADLCDAHPDRVEVTDPIFNDYGGLTAFGGPITTVKLFEDNVLVRKALEQPGQGRVLVVDGGGSTRCALVGDRLAALARDNGWAGIVVYGCIRDAAPISEIAIGLKAIGTCPRKSIKRGQGQVDLTVTFAGVRFVPGAWVYADRDGVIVAPEAIEPA